MWYYIYTEYGTLTVLAMAKPYVGQFWLWSYTAAVFDFTPAAEPTAKSQGLAS